MRSFDLDIDVTAAAALGETVHAKVTVTLPDSAKVPTNPIVCFALPGAGFARRYFTFDMPGARGGGQAGWHALRGWIFVAVDTLGVGEASLPAPAKLLYQPLAAVNHAVAQEVLQRLAAGTLATDFPPVKSPVVLGMGQSMGGCLTVVQQARCNTFDAIAVLGFSTVHTRQTMLPGTPRARNAYITRDLAPKGDDYAPTAAQAHFATNAVQMQFGLQAFYPNAQATPPGWSYHFDDEPPEIVKQDLDTETLAPWRSATVPGAVFWVTAPGTIAAEAASIVVPVLAAYGERDTLDDPRMECKAYRAAVDFSLFICPRMAHMHNFASTRELLWSRIEAWGQHVAALKQQLPDNWPSGLFSDSY